MRNRTLEILLIIAIGIVLILALRKNWFWLYYDECQSLILGHGLVYFGTSLGVGAIWPRYSWKGGLFTLVPIILFSPLFLIMMGFMGEDPVKIFSALLEGRCNYFHWILIACLVAPLGGLIGARLPLRKPGMGWASSLRNAGFLILIIGALVLSYKSWVAKLKEKAAELLYHEYDVVAPIPEIEIKALPKVALQGRTYRTISVNGVQWMSENLQLDIGTGSMCYQKDPSNCQEHGYLYTWEGAIEACASVGWRLPTRSDWDLLVNAHSNYQDAYKALVEGGKSAFDAQLGGSYQPPTKRFENLGQVGGYWSSTEDPEMEGQAWKVGFRSEIPSVRSEYFPKDWAFSCRCVSDPSTEN